jgi:hypothetical protein
MPIFGTLPGICCAPSVRQADKDLDYPKFAEPFRGRLRENAGKPAAAAGIEIQFIASATSARKIWRVRRRRNGAVIPAWCAFHRRWTVFNVQALA